MRNSNTNPGGASGLRTLSKIGLTSRMRNAAIAPTTAISTTDAREYSAYGRTYSSNRQMRLKPSLSRSSISHGASHHSMARRNLASATHELLLRHIPMRRLNPVALFGQPLLHLFRDEYRSMLSSRTSKTHRQITFPLFDVVRQKKLQHIRRLIQKLLRLRELTHILGHLRILPRQLAKLRHKMRIRQKAHIEHEIRFRWHAVLESRTIGRDHQTLIALLTFKL